jgi:flagellar export protein FliJ
MKKLEVATVAKKLRVLELRLEGLRTTIQKLLEMKSIRPDPNLAHYQNLKIDLDSQDVSLTEKIIAEQRSQLEQRRDELSHIIHRKRALESLKEKKWKEHRVFENRRLQKNIDEVFQLSKVRK